MTKKSKNRINQETDKVENSAGFLKKFSSELLKLGKERERKEIDKLTEDARNEIRSTWN